MSTPVIEQIPLVDTITREPSGLAVSESDADILALASHLTNDEFQQWLDRTWSDTVQGRHLDGTSDADSRVTGTLANAKPDEELEAVDAHTAELGQPIVASEVVVESPLTKRQKVSQFIAGMFSTARQKVHAAVEYIAPTKDTSMTLLAHDFDVSRRVIDLTIPTTPSRMEHRMATPTNREELLYAAADIVGWMSNIPHDVLSTLPLAVLEQAFADFAFDNGVINPADTVSLRNALDDVLSEQRAAGKLVGRAEQIAEQVHTARLQLDDPIKLFAV